MKISREFLGRHVRGNTEARRGDDSADDMAGKSRRQLSANGFTAVRQRVLLLQLRIPFESGQGVRTGPDTLAGLEGDVLMRYYCIYRH